MGRALPQFSSDGAHRSDRQFLAGAPEAVQELDWALAQLPEIHRPPFRAEGHRLAPLPEMLRAWESHAPALTKTPAMHRQISRRPDNQSSYGCRECSMRQKGSHSHPGKPACSGGVAREGTRSKELQSSSDLASEGS